MWVTQPVEDLVTRIDPRTNRVVARVRFPRNAEPVALAFGVGSLWAGGPKQPFRIDLRTNHVVASAPIGRHTGSDYNGLREIAIDGGTLWVADGDADTLDGIPLAG
jgi:hypothetical protein